MKFCAGIGSYEEAALFIKYFENQISIKDKKY
jgi:hypothetical protein